jgi:hypothetical protein
MMTELPPLDSAVLPRAIAAGANVRFGSKADTSPCPRNVRFTPESGNRLSRSGCPLCAKSKHSQQNQRNMVGRPAETSSKKEAARVVMGLLGAHKVLFAYFS